MATQVRPLAGGAWNAVTLLPNNRASKTQNYGISIAPQQQSNAVRALNEWLNAAGTGQAAVRAQKTAAALKLQLQEV